MGHLFPIPMTKRCATPKCTGKPFGSNKFCGKCYTRQWRERNPARYAYNKLKSNAKRRKKGFTLTFEEFQDFCAETGYLELRGRDADSATIDRIGNDGPYSRDNIQVLTNSENSSKPDKPYNPFYEPGEHPFE